MAGCLISRRGALIAPALAGLDIYFHRHEARAQEGGAALAELLKVDRARLADLNAKLRNPEFLANEERMAEVQRFDVEQRKEEARQIRDYISLSGWDVATFRTKASDLFDPNVDIVTSLIFKNEVSIIPDPAQITPPEKAPTPKLKPRRTINVLVDILLETFGLVDVEKIAVEVLHEIPGLDEKFGEAEQAVKERNSQKIVDATYGIVDFILKQAVLDPFIAKLIAKGVGKVLLRQFALRMVPFLGWAWLFVALGIAISHHWEELWG
jgi:hypothetical protein